MKLIDTHCHIHEHDYPLAAVDVMRHAHKNGVEKLIVVGTNAQSSKEAVVFAGKYQDVWAAVGAHPHDAKDGLGELPGLLAHNRATLAKMKIVAIGEIGLDYFYNHSVREVQIEVLHQQIELALKHDLPISFHVREAFGDFWPIYDNFASDKRLRGVLHSFTDSSANLEKALTRDLMIGVNGIATFCKDQDQCEMYASIPLSKLLLETDAPFLTPTPNRGKVNEPAFVRVTAEFLSELYHVSVEALAHETSRNAEALFSI